MISEEKIRHMTDVAMLWKKGERREAEACKYRRKDYIVLHIVGIWVSGTVAYFMMTVALLVFILGKNPDQYIALETLTQVTMLWGLIYLIYCLILVWIAWMCYSVRYRNARSWHRKYHYALHILEEYYRTPAESGSDDNWMVSTEEGNQGKL